MNEEINLYLKEKYDEWQVEHKKLLSIQEQYKREVEKINENSDKQLSKCFSDNEYTIQSQKGVLIQNVHVIYTFSFG